MDDGIEFKPGHIEIIVKLFESNVRSINSRLDRFEQCQTDKDKKVDDLIQAALRETEQSIALRKDIRSMIEDVRGSVHDILDPAILGMKAEVKAIDERLSVHIGAHEKKGEFRLKKWQIILGVPAVVILIVKAAYDFWFFLRGYFTH